MFRPTWQYALLSIAITLSPLTAGEWEPIPPNGKSVTDFLVDPHRVGGLYASTGDELLWSPDRGDEWVRLLDVDAFLGREGVIRVFTADWHEPETLYVGVRTSEARFLKSTDHGRTWTVADFSGDWFYGLESDAHHPGALVATTDEGVVGSRDGGDSWTLLFGGPPDYEGHYNDLLIHPSQPDLFFVSAGHCSCDTYLFRSGDGGSSWQASTDGLPVGELLVFAVATAPSNPSVMYTAGPGGIGGGGVFRSEDQGSSWAHIGLEGGVIWTLSVDPHDADGLLAGSGSKSDLGGGIFRTRDGGDSWTRIHDTQPARVAFDPQSPGIAYATVFEGPGYGLYRTDLEQPATAIESTAWGDVKNRTRVNMALEFQIGDNHPRDEGEDRRGH